MDLKEQVERHSKKTSVVYVIAAVVVCASALFKIMHWPYSVELELARTIAFIAVFAALIYENKWLKKMVRNK